MATYTEFINPYIFVPLGGEVKRDDKENLSEKLGDVYTGKLQVTLKTRTPLFIPDTHGRKKKDEKKGKPQHQTYTFFSYDGINPVIPGPSLNGLLRNNYETVTNSCLSVVDMDEKPVRRTNEYYDKGLLYRDQKGNLTLYKAAKATVKPDKRPDRNQYQRPVRTKEFYEGAQVKASIFRRGIEILAENVRTLKEATNGKNSGTTGYYFKGEPGVNKKEPCNAYVFYFEDEKKKEVVKDGLKADSLEIRQLLDVLKSYGELAEKKSARKGHHGYKEYSDRLKNFLQSGTGYFPVHYSEEAGYLYLSPACITKEVYYTSIKEIIEKQEKHHTCNNIHHLCPGCRLFGMVGQGTLEEKDYPNAWAGSVRVQDAVLKNEKDPQKIYMDEITLMELGSPRKSSTEFYLQKPEGEAGEEVLSWTYDYYMAKDSELGYKVAAYTPRISGRKFYWHHIRPNLPKEFVEVTDRNCTIKPIRKDVEFTFPVYFEKVTAQQLQQLIWLCNISSEKVKGRAKYGYKLGKGKPLGLGSVELTVEKVQIRALKKNGEICYHLESYEEMFGESYQKLTYEKAGFDGDIKGAFLRICDFEAVGRIPVTYPVGKYQSVVLAIQGFRWFGNNHFKVNGGNGKITKRKELIFQQYMNPLNDSDSVTLTVNADTEDTYDVPYDYRAKANNNCPAVGSKVWGTIQKMDHDNVYIKVKANTISDFEVKVRKNRDTQYEMNTSVYTEIKKIFIGPKGASYEGKDVTPRERS